MKNVLVCSMLAAILLVPVTALAESHAWTRDRDGVQASSPAAAPLSLESHFRLSPSKLNLCSASATARHRLDLTAAPGLDLIEDSDLDLQSLLAQAAFKANAALLSAEPGRDLTNPEEVKQLVRPSRPAADVSVDGDEVDLRLQIFRDAGACAASNVSTGGLRRITAEADSCSGACDCTTCVCQGSLSCCEAGCDACWEYRDSAGLCGAT